jgi:outer membrane receptor protein involved in Fe transport
MKLIAKAVVAAAMVLLAAAPLMAQTTGRITGTILDDSGAAVPGAVVTALGNLGSNTTTTDANGAFRFLSLRPGTYTVRVELAGFKTIEQTGVIVGIDRTVNLRMAIEVATVTETITVRGESPAIDVTSTTTGVNATAELFNRLPIARDVYDLAQVAPGIQQDTWGAAVAGSTGAENAYIIEGLNTTGVELGVEGKQLNFDFVEEIEVKTGGLPAEYGRTTGGVVNVLTKSGGNQFRGGLFGFYEGGGLFADDKTAPKRHQDTTQVETIDNRWDFGGELGGYLVQDKLWFFGAYNRTSRTDNIEVIRDIAIEGAPAAGSVVPRDDTRDLFAGKLTWRLSPNHTITGSVFGDPGNEAGPVFDIAGPEIAWKGEREFGSTDYVVRYDGTLGNAFLIRAMWGKHQESNTILGPGKALEGFGDFTVTPTAYTNGFWFHQDFEFGRDVFKLDLTKFFGSHEFKVGGDYQVVDTLNNNWNGGNGQRIYTFQSGDTIYYRHRFYVDDTAPGFDRDDPATWTIAAPLTSEPRTKNLSLYLQDSWKVTSSFTLNVGLRWEQQDVQDRNQQSAFKLSDNWAPRVGFVWDVAGNGRSKLFANYGRFYENIPQDINIRAFGGEVQCFCYNFDPSPGNILPDPDTPRRSSLLGGQEPVDPDLKGQYIDEWLGGFEYEVAPNFVLGTKVAYRKLGRVIEDFLDVGSGDYAIVNPSEGSLGQTITFYDYYYYDPDDPRVTAPAPAAEREYWSVEFNARKRFSDNWQFLASYVWNKLEGNYDGLFQNSTGQLDPNINSAFDYADFMVNSRGRLSSERQHQLKFNGSYQVSEGALDGLNLGLSTWWYSGLPLNAYGYSFGYQNHEFYLVPRGSLGRGPSNWEADIHVSYPIRVGERARINVIADVFNLFNRQAIIQYDERYNRAQDDFCGGIPDDICSTMGGIDHIAGTTEPAGALSDPRATTTNPDFLTKGTDSVNSFTGNRSIRLGLRFTF